MATVTRNPSSHSAYYFMARHPLYYLCEGFILRGRFIRGFSFFLLQKALGVGGWTVSEWGWFLLYDHVQRVFGSMFSVITILWKRGVFFFFPLKLYRLHRTRDREWFSIRGRTVNTITAILPLDFLSK